MKLYETESLSEKQRDKLTSYFKLKKIKRISKWLHSLVMIAYSEKKKERLWVSFAGKCDRNADMWHLLVLRTKDIFWVQIVKYELCKGIKEYGEI
jgi:hypothetical protein